MLVLTLGAAAAFGARASAASIWSALSSPDGGQTIAEAFESAAKRYKIPLPLLLALSYHETRWNGRGCEQRLGRFGIMNLELSRASELSALGVDFNVAAVDPASNIEAAARSLDRRARELRLDRARLEAWIPALEDGDVLSRWRAYQVYAILKDGVVGFASDGSRLEVPPQAVDLRIFERDPRIALNRGAGTPFDFPAGPGHFRRGRRKPGDVKLIVIHAMDGTLVSSAGWFRDPRGETSAHYLVGRRGAVVAVVKEKDIANHVRASNDEAIGIENEGCETDPGWASDEVYRNAARLTREAARRWGVPLTRSRIVGHVEVPDNDHTDPGRYWDWEYFMALVTRPGSPPAKLLATSPADGSVTAREAVFDIPTPKSAVKLKVWGKDARLLFESGSPSEPARHSFADRGVHVLTAKAYDARGRLVGRGLWSVRVDDATPLAVGR